MFKTDSLKPSFLKRIIGLKVGNELTEIWLEDFQRKLRAKKFED